MNILEIDDTDRLRQIIKALMYRVEQSTDQQSNSFSLFQTAIALEGQVRRRTTELTHALHRLEAANDELAEQKEVSERANRSKTQFLAAASHDVLQPLHAAQLLLSTLAEMQTTDKAVDLVRQTERSLDTMSELLRKLLDISKIDVGVVVPVLETVSLRPFVEEIAAEFHPIADRFGLQLRVQAEDVAIETDRTMLRSILHNLVSNALRYTDRGSVLISVRNVNNQAIVEVIDTGIGVPDDQRDNIFEEFNRGSQAKSQERNEGAGLGLAIVARLIDLLGYSITLQSKIGKGSRFSLGLGNAVVADTTFTGGASGKEIEGRTGIAGTKVLLVENEPNVVEAMLALLGSWNCNVRAVSSESAALTKLADPEWVPDLIVADQHLDFGELGTNVIREVRRRCSLDLPAIIVTADPTEEVSSVCAELGVELMVKPLKPAQLRALIYHLIDQKAA